MKRKKNENETFVTDFFKFPSTPHISWLGKATAPREDKMLTTAQMDDLLSGEVTVEEKVDGANIGITIGPHNKVQVQNRGQYLTEPYIGQFSRLNFWIKKHSISLSSHLPSNLIIFGEWCAAKHSISYQLLPDFFLLFDVYDKTEERFWSTLKRNQLASKIGLATVPTIATFQQVALYQLEELVNKVPSRFRNGQPMEGIVVRKDSSEWCESRAKLVRAGFTQSINIHWSKRAIEWNKINYEKNSSDIFNL